MQIFIVWIAFLRDRQSVCWYWHQVPSGDKMKTHFFKVKAVYSFCSLFTYFYRIYFFSSRLSQSHLTHHLMTNKWRISEVRNYLHVTYHKNYLKTNIYIYIYIYANFIKHNRHFMSTYFLLYPFEFPYYFYCILGELIYVLSIVACIPSTFCPTLGHHQGRIYIYIHI